MKAALWHRLPEQFEAQLDMVAGRVAAYHFDDAYDDVLRAADALEARGLVGVFFVVSGWVGLPGQASAAQVRALVGRGHEVGNHTAHHVLAHRVPVAVLESEIMTCQHALADLTGTWPQQFAWPYGQFDAPARLVVSRLGPWETLRGISDDEIVAPRDLSPADLAGRL